MWAWVILVGLTAASYLLRPKQQGGMAPSTLSDVDAPIAAEGKELGVLFGTRDIKSPNFVWYGDLRTKAIRKKGGKK